MKHLLPLALLIGLGVPAAWGQTVTILDKEGISHRFNADYVKEITFTKQAAAEPLTYTDVACTPYSGGECLLAFTGEDCPTVTLDVHGTPDALYLMTGEYTVAETGTEMYIDPNPTWTNVEKGGQKLTVTGGKMTVEEGMEGQYDISCTLALSDGTDLSGQWTGLISNYGKIMNLNADTAKQIELRDAAPGQIRLRFSNSVNYSYEATVDFYMPAGATVIPEGSYFWNADKTPSSIGPDSSIEIYTPYAQPKAVEGVAFVRADGMTVALDLEDGRTVNIFFNGQVNYLPAPEPTRVVYPDGEANPYSQGNVSLTFSGDGMDTVALDVYGTYDATYLQAGTYTVAASGTSMYINNSDLQYTYVYADGQKVAISGGEMKVTEESDGSYSITFDFTLANGTKLSGEWKGSLPNYDKVQEFSADEAKQVDFNNPAPGQIRLRFNDSNWSYEATVDFFVTPGATTVAPGTYTWSSDGAAGTIGGETGISIYNPSYTGKATGGSVTVTESGMAITMNFADGKCVKIDFTGTVTYL